MNTNVIIEILNQFGTSAVQDTVTNYTNWFIWSSIIWIVFSLLLMFVGGLIAKGKLFEKTCETTEMAFRITLGLLIILIGAIMFCSNLEDLVSPRAIAIHQLITDITR